MGLMRLWVIPEGAKSADGVYLRYPLDDLLRLTALESHRGRAIVIGENLGTVPQGFNETLAYRGLAGMQVLWFEQENGQFIPARRWRRDSVAMTTTHDLPTVAGWWNGRDIEWRAKAGIRTFTGDETAEWQERRVEKQKLWQAMADSGCVPSGGQPDDTTPVVDGAVKFIGGTPCSLAIVPVEDICALEDQPNLPGTIDQHPNWRRRLPPGNFFAQPGVAERLDRFRRARQ
jgi:4-alpha-glucanotransferase